MKNPVDKELQKKQEELDQLNQDIEIGHGTLNANASAANRAQGEFEDWDKKRKEAEKATETALKAKEKAEKDLEDIHATTKTESEALSTLKTDVRAQTQKVEALKKEQTDLVVSIKHQTDTAAQKISTENTTLEQKRDGLLKAISDGEAKLKSINGAIESGKVESAKISNLIVGRREDLDAVDRQIAKGQKKVDDFNKKFKEVTLNLDTASAQIVIVEKQKADIYEEIRLLKADNEIREQMKVTLLAEIKELESHKAELETEREELKKEKLSIIDRRVELFDKEQKLRAKYTDVGLNWE